jgi:Mycotoxin biosynthesis protein UstYa
MHSPATLNSSVSHLDDHLKVSAYDVLCGGYADGDYPETWPVDRPTVLLASDNTQRFRLNTSEGAAEWSAIVPGDGLVRLGAKWEPYTISMIHQLRCLSILRRDVVREGPASGGPTALGRHCLNYLKQMVLCRGDIQVEAMHYKTHKDPIDLFGIYECRDWGAVYDAVRGNQQAYKNWQTSSQL